MSPIGLVAGMLTLAVGLPTLAAAPAVTVFHWKVPHAVQEVQVPEAVFAADFPVTMQAVKTTEKLEDLIRFFVIAFEKADLYIPPASLMPAVVRHSSLTALDTRTLISYAVMFQLNPDGTTTVITSQTFLNERRPPAAAFTAVFPGAKEQLVSSSEGTRTLSYSAAAKIEEVEGFYREVLATTGYRQLEPGLFAKAGEQLQVLARPEAGGQIHVTVFQRLAN